VSAEPGAGQNQIRKVGEGEITFAEDVRTRVDNLLTLIPEPQHQSLTRDVLDEMSASTEKIPNFIQIFGTRITGKSLADEDRAVRRFFTPILNNPSDGAVAWMLKIFEERPDFLKNISSTLRDEFSSRLIAAMQASTASDQAKQDFNKIAMLAGVTIPSAPGETGEH
jgi:hypothetical protein